MKMFRRSWIGRKDRVKEGEYESGGLVGVEQIK